MLYWKISFLQCFSFKEVFALSALLQLYAIRRTVEYCSCWGLSNSASKKKSVWYQQVTVNGMHLTQFWTSLLGIQSSMHKNKSRLQTCLALEVAVCPPPAAKRLGWLEQKQTLESGTPSSGSSNPRAHRSSTRTVVCHSWSCENAEDSRSIKGWEVTFPLPAYDHIFLCSYLKHI